MKISIENLSLEIGEKKILTNVSFNTLPSEITKIVGANGSGKTSLLNCILGIYNDYSGLVKFNDDLIEPNKQLKYNRQISFLINQPMFYPQLTVSDNINIFKYYYKVKEIEVSLNQLFIDFGLNNFSDTNASKLSEGFKKKLSLILSLINDGEAIILDEPFNFLDQNAIEVLSKYLFDSTLRNKSVIVSAHQSQIFGDIKHQILNL
jgi:ABC-type multidrug transport system ATPase subunit